MKAHGASFKAATWSLGVLAAQACGGALAADEGTSWRLVKSVTGPNSAKPAEVLYVKEDETSSTATSAALLWRGSPLPTFASNMANSWGLSVGFSKNTLSTKRTEFLTAGANVRSVIAVSKDKASNIVANLDVLLEDDREHDARGHSFVLDATLVSPSLHLDPGLEPKKKEMGLDTWLYPSVGLYKRRISSTDSPADTPEGSHGGAYLGLRLTSRFLSLGKDLALFDRVSFEAVAIRTRESSVSGGYAKDSYRYGELSLDYLLYGEAVGKGWKPTIGYTRAKGTNRPANEPRVDRSVVTFKVSYGV